MRITPAGRSAAAPKTSTSLFDYGDGACSLSQDQLKAINANPPTWPVHDAKAVRQTAMATLILHATGGRWSLLKHGWRNLLVTPGLLLIKRGTDRAMFVISVMAALSARLGVLGIRR